MSRSEHEDTTGRRPGAVIPEPAFAPEIPLPPEPVAAPETAPPVVGAALPGVTAPGETRPRETGPGQIVSAPAPTRTVATAPPGASAVPASALPGTDEDRPQDRPGPAGDSNGSLPTGHERGATTVAEIAVAKVIGIAVRQVPGVHALGSNTARALGQIRDAVGQSDHAQGISVEMGERQVAVDITLVAAYPWPLQEVARNVRAAVYDAVEGLIGKDVAEVNVTIADIDVPELDRAPAGRAHPEPKERRIP